MDGWHFKSFRVALILLLAGIFSGTGICQEINLDKMKKLENLICYQSLKDPAAWYYLPDQPRLAMKNGKPLFSFMKYSRTHKTGKAGTNMAEGGGIVHFLVTYGTSRDRILAAERKLREEQPDASIKGPIVYRKGSFALITSFQQDQQTLVRTVAVGKAPLMEGQKAAVSMALSRQGAELLWESFKSDTPDISLVFDMEFAGTREPCEATIIADWSRISRHKRVKAGMKYSWFGADVDMLFQELQQDGSIRITTRGENAGMDKIIESAHAKLLQVMFDPAPVDDLSRAAAEKDSYSSLNQAMKLLKSSRGRKSSLNMNSPGFRQMMAGILDILIPDAFAQDEPKLPPLPLENTEDEIEDTQDVKLKFPDDTLNSSKQNPPESASEAYNLARHFDQQAKDTGYPSLMVQAAINAYEDYQQEYSPTGARAEEVKGRIRSLKRRLPHAVDSKEIKEVPLAPVPGSAAGTKKHYGSKNKVLPTAKSMAGPAKSSVKKKPAPVLHHNLDKKPGFSFVASFQMKNIKRSGKMVYHMNHFRSEKQSFTMTENIGSLYSRYGKNNRIFRAVTLDDPVFKQREILVTLDGQDSATFTKYLNFVTVKMNKHHLSGSDTHDEVVITPETFNKNENFFSLNYGYKEDTDRNLWLEYKYQVIWSFHGGIEIRSPWKKTNNPILALYPPYRYRSLIIEGEGDILRKANVRHAVITITTRINGEKITTQAFIRNQGPAPALHMDIPENLNGDPCDVSITWYLKGGKKVSLPPQKLDSDIIYWDELPEKERT